MGLKYTLFCWNLAFVHFQLTWEKYVFYCCHDMFALMTWVTKRLHPSASTLTVSVKCDHQLWLHQSISLPTPELVCSSWDAPCLAPSPVQWPGQIHSNSQISHSSFGPVWFILGPSWSLAFPNSSYCLCSPAGYQITFAKHWEDLPSDMVSSCKKPTNYKTWINTNGTNT